MSKKRSRKTLDDGDSDVSIEEKKLSSSNQKRKHKQDSSDTSDVESDEWNAKKSNKKLTKSKAIVAESEVEEGEVSSSGGGSGSESEVFDDGYDEEFIGDEEDRHRLEAMTEKEREEEIYLRAERREALKTRFLIQKKMREQKKKSKVKEETKSNEKVSKKSSTRREDMHEDDEALDRRKTNENRKKETHVSKALENLKATREKKKQLAEDNKQRLEKAHQQQQQQQEKKLRPEDVYSSSDSDNDETQDEDESSSSDSDSTDHTKSQSQSDSIKQKQHIQTKDELTRIKLSRTKIELWFSAPFFKEVSCGCFVKIGIGNNVSGPVYRIAEVIDVVDTPKVYSLGKYRTNKGFKLRIGGADRVFRLEFVSNQPFADDEFIKWKETMQKENRIMPTLYQIEQKEKDIAKAKAYEYSEEDISKMIEEKKKFNKNSTKIAELKIELLKQKEKAEQNDDVERLREIALELMELDSKSTTMDRMRSNGSLITAINARNREASQKSVEAAIRKEFEQKEKAPVFDPFTRRKCIPTLVSQSLKKETASTATTSTDLTKTNGQQLSNSSIKITPSLSSSNLLNASLTKCENSNDLYTKKSEDLFSVHNFEIHINLSSDTSLTDTKVVAETSVTNIQTPSLSRRTLNLEAYKRQKGLI